MDAVRRRYRCHYRSMLELVFALPVRPGEQNAAAADMWSMLHDMSARPWQLVRHVRAAWLCGASSPPRPLRAALPSHTHTRCACLRQLVPCKAILMDKAL